MIRSQGRIEKIEESMRSSRGFELVPVVGVGCEASSGLVMRSAKEPPVSALSVDIVCMFERL